MQCNTYLQWQRKNGKSAGISPTAADIYSTSVRSLNIYTFKLHNYTIMANPLHVLVENNLEILSEFMVSYPRGSLTGYMSKRKKEQSIPCDLVLADFGPDTDN
jgi:hypothetical protein